MTKMLIYGAVALVFGFIVGRALAAQKAAGTTSAGTSVVDLFGKLTPDAKKDIAAAPTSRRGKGHF